MRYRGLIVGAALLVPAGFWIAPLTARTHRINSTATQDEDEDERQYRAAIARRALEDNCLICHSEELITTQRLTPAQWKAEVEKMVAWGAPVPPEQQPLLIDDLSRRYSDRTPAEIPGRTSYAQAIAPLRPQPSRTEDTPGERDRGAKLYATQCANCHGSDGQGAELGPNLVERPVLLRALEFHEVTRQGRRRMPGFQATLQPAQVADILAWLKARRYRAARAK